MFTDKLLSDDATPIILRRNYFTAQSISWIMRSKIYRY